MHLKLKNGFKTMSDAKLQNRAYQIVTSMTGNENFPSPQPGIDAVQETIDAFFYALSNCSDGDRLNIAIKNQKREALVGVLQQWAYYVLLTADNDAVIAISSGYEISKSPEPTPPIEKPDAPKLESGLNPGELVSKGKPVTGAVSYLHQYATEVLMAADNWQSVACSKSTCLLTNLQPGIKYFCRIVVVGRKEQLVYSDIVTRIAA